MIIKFNFQRDEVSFSFLLSHPTALPCIGRSGHTVYIRAIHQLFQDTKLLFGGRRHKVLPLFRQNRQIGDAPLDILFIIHVGPSQLYQMPDAPADQIAVTLPVAILTVGCTEDFGVGHGNGRFFRHDQFCDKNPSNLFLIAICTAANAALKSDGFSVRFVQGFVLVRHIGRNLKITLVLGVVCIGVKGFFCSSAAFALLWLFRCGGRQGLFWVVSWHHAPLQIRVFKRFIIKSRRKLSSIGFPLKRS